MKEAKIINEVTEEEFYEDHIDYINSDGEAVEYDEDSQEAYEIFERNRARKTVLDMINEHCNLQLKGLRHIKRTDDDGVRTLCHSCVCYEMPGIVSIMCFGGITPEGEYVYFWG